MQGGRGRAIGFVILGILGSPPVAAELPTKSTLQAVAAEDANSRDSALKIAWRSDYRTATDEARRLGKQALIWFIDPTWGEPDDKFSAVVLQTPEIASRLDVDFVPVKVPVAARVRSGEQDITVLDNAAFADLHHWPGLAVIDYRDPDSPHFGRVVSVYPFLRDYISRERLAVMLDLPAGSLTQRTLIFAVRTHPERPASTSAELGTVLVEEAAKHAAHQANIALQGHHNWEARFHSINARLPGGLLAQEVCAESWPGQGLVDAAIECVDSWRHSPGHWQAVSSRHEFYGYDMQRGANGTWYAAGIFAKR